MELNKTYPINIICRTEEGRASFIAVERLNSESSVRFQEYYQKLLRFNKCGSWFQNLDYPPVDVGSVVIAKINNSTNLWARGVISNVSFDGRISVYLLDHQKIMYNTCKEFVDLRICPKKFEQLKLPTFLIDTNICLDDDDLKSAVENLIGRSQHGELCFCFVPKSVQNCIYSGELIVNNKTDNLYIPLKKLLKNFHSKKYFNDMPVYGEQTFTFNPFKLTYLRDIFDPTNYFTEMVNFKKSDKYQVSNNLDIDAINNSFETLSCDTQDEFSSTLDYLEDYSSSDGSEKNTQNVTVAKQKAYSSFSSSMNASNSSLQSTSSFEKNRSSMINKLNGICQNSENQNALDLSVADNGDETKSDVNTIDTILNDTDPVCMSSCTESDTCSTNAVILETKQDIIDRTTKMDDSEIKSFISKMMKKRFSHLSKMLNSKNTEYKESNNLCVIEKKPPEINNKQTHGQDDIWWTDDES